VDVSTRSISSIRPPIECHKARGKWAAFFETFPKLRRISILVLEPIFRTGSGHAEIPFFDPRYRPVLAVRAQIIGGRMPDESRFS